MQIFSTFNTIFKIITHSLGSTIILALLFSKASAANESSSCMKQWWLQGDYLLWKAKDTPLPVPLVTLASLSDPISGALGQPGTKVLIGDKNVDLPWLNGFKIAAGLWTDQSQQKGIEGSYFLLPERSQKQSVTTSGQPGSINAAVPIYDITGLWGLNGIPGETVFILPGPIFGPGFAGRFQLTTSIRLQGAELNAFVRKVNNPAILWDFIGGFRWIQLEESLSFIGQTAAVPNSTESGFYNFKDSFRTNNNFFGGQVGMKAACASKICRVIGFTKVALGSMNQNVGIRGRSRTSNGNLFYLTHNTETEILNGGIFAEPSNEGSHCRNAFAAVVEAGIKMCCKITGCLEVGLGYNFLFASSFLRPGDQIERKINPTQTALAEASRASAGVGPDTPIPFGESQPASLPKGLKSPRFKPHTSNFWIQGLTIDAQLQF